MKSPLRRPLTVAVALLLPAILVAGLGLTVSPTDAAHASNVSMKVKAIASTTIKLKALTATPTPKISGSTLVGATLMVSSAPWAPAPVALSYQWSANGVAISKASSNRFVLTSAQVGRRITVTVVGRKTGYTSVAKISAATTPIVAPKALSSAPTPMISGSPIIGTRLTVTPGAWKPAPVSLAYQWRASGIAIPKATSVSFVPTAAVKGKQLTVSVTGSKPGYTTTVKTSAATAAVVSVATLTKTAVPTVSGFTNVGSLLTANPGTWAPAPVSFRYQWSAGGVAISGASGPILTLAAAQIGKAITVSVTGSRAGYASVTTTSRATAAVSGTALLTATPKPSIIGSARVGSVLTAAPGTWTPAPIALSYQWFSDAQPIDGATAPTFAPTVDDEGAKITLTVTGTRSGYRSVSTTSAPTATVAGPAVVKHVSGPVVSSTTWSPAGGTVYEIDAPLTVPAGVTLTVAPGTVVLADETASITVAGTLVTQGTTAAPVVVQPTRLLDANGWAVRPWGGVTVSGAGTLTLATTSIVGVDQGVSTSNSSTTSRPTIAISNSHVEASRSGISASGGPFTLKNSIVDGGVTYRRSSDYASRLDPIVVTGNTITGAPLNVVSQNASVGVVPLVVSGNRVSGVTSQGTAVPTFPVQVYDSALRPSNLTGNVPAGNGSNTIALGGTLVENWSVSASGPRLVLDGQVANDTALTVSKGVTMTIAAGAVIKFGDDSYYQPNETIVVAGSLVSNGTAAAPVVLTSVRDDSVGGDTNNDQGEFVPSTSSWSGISVSSGGALTLTNTTVDYATSPVTTGSGPATVTIASSRLLDSKNGVHLYSGAYSVTNSVVDGGLTAIRDSTYASRLFAVTLTGNSVTDGPLFVESTNSSNGLVPIKVADNSVSGVASTSPEDPTYPVTVYDAALRPSNLSGNKGSGNASDGFEIGGTLLENWTVPSSGFHYVLFDQRIEGAYGTALTIAAGAAMTVPAGVVVKVASHTNSLYTRKSIDVKGSLSLLGTATAPTALTSSLDDSVGGDLNADSGEATPSAGDWNGIVVHDGAHLTLRHALLAYTDDALYSDSFSSTGGSPSVSISDSQVLSSLSGGYLAGGAVTVADSTIDGGLYVNRSNDYAARLDAVSVTGNTFTHGALRVWSSNAWSTASAITVSDNTVKNVASGYPIVVVDALLRPSRLTGNTGVANSSSAFAIGGQLVENWSMPSTGLPYVFAYDYDQTGTSLSVKAGVTLTVPAGVVIKVDNGRNSNFWRTHVRVLGTLVVAGTAARPVVMTSSLDDSVGGDTNGDESQTSPAIRDWEGIVVGESGTVRGDHFDLLYSDDALETAGTVALTNSSVQHASTCVYQEYGAASTSISGTIGDCVGGVVNASGPQINARNVDWGDADGPAPLGKGVAVTGDVGVVPWVGYVAPPAPAAAPNVTVQNPCSAYDTVVIVARGSGEIPVAPGNMNASNYDSMTYSQVVNGGTPLEFRGVGQMENQFLYGNHVTDAFSPQGYTIKHTGKGFMNLLADVSPTAVGRTKVIPLVYPAANANEMAFQNMVPSAYPTGKGYYLHVSLAPMLDYLSSMSTGVIEMENQIKHVAYGCPNQKLVLVGYSQGAIVIRLALAGLTATTTDLSRYIDSNVVGVSFVGDPLNEPSAGTTGTYYGTDNGVDEGLISKLFDVGWIKDLGTQLIGSEVSEAYPSSLVTRTTSLCDKSDFFCAPFAPGGLPSFDVHGGYATSDFTDMSTWMVKQIDPTDTAAAQ